MIGIALATGWAPSEVRALTLPEVGFLGETFLERKRKRDRAEARARASAARGR